AYGRYNRFGNRYDSLSPGRDTWTSGRFGMRADIQLSSRDNLMVQADGMNSPRSDSVVFPVIDPPYSRIQTDRRVSSGFDVVGRWTRERVAGGSLTVTSYYDRTTRRE